MKDREKKLKWMLGAVGLVMCVGIAFNLWICFNKLSILLSLPTASDSNVTVVVALDMLTTLLDTIILVLFVRFSLSITRKSEFFSTKQTRRLFTAAVLYAIIVVLGLLYPSFDMPQTLVEFTGELRQEPLLDIRILLFSLVFFALSAIFEYGRMLQEDSNNIL